MTIFPSGICDTNSSTVFEYLILALMYTAGSLLVNKVVILFCERQNYYWVKITVGPRTLKFDDLFLGEGSLITLIVSITVSLVP